MFTWKTAVLSIGVMGSLLIITTSGLKQKRKNNYLQRYHGDTFGIFTGNYFSFKTTLQEPEKDIDFTFILVRHGMVLPYGTPYAFDFLNYHKFGTIWKTDETTERGKQLMNMVGRSLKTRYKSYLNTLPWDKISLTTLRTGYSDESGEYLLQGLLRETAHEMVLDGQQSGKPSVQRINKEGHVDYDRYSLQSDKECTWLHRILEELNSELSIPDNYVFLKYCTPTLYARLRQFTTIIQTTGAKSGRIESPEDMYELWHTLLFEVQEGDTFLKWIKDHWANMQACVFEYFRLLSDWHPDVTPAVIGRMFNQIKKEAEEGKVKFHIHITNDKTFTPLMWSLPGNPRNQWPHFGDALILDFYKDKEVSVSLFSGVMERHETLLRCSYETLKTHFMERRVDLTIEEYKQLCNFKPKE